jgi:hypothetical protein
LEASRLYASHAEPESPKMQAEIARIPGAGYGSGAILNS